MEKNFEEYQNPNSFQEKEAVNSNAVFRNALESFTSTTSCPSSLNQISSGSESVLINSVGGAGGERKKILQTRHKAHDTSLKLEECQPKFNIPYEDHRVMENKNTFEKNASTSDGISENQSVNSKIPVSEKCGMLTEDLKDFSVNLSTKMKSEVKEPMFETKTMEKICDQVKDDGIANENLKKATPEECNRLMELPIEIYSGGEAERKSLINVSGMVKESDENDISSEEKIHDVELLGMPNGYAAFSNYLDIKIPRIGKHVFQNEERPLTNCYDLAIERNEKRFKTMRETGIDDDILRLVDEEANMSESDKKKKKIEKQQENIEMARYVTKICLKILEELRKERINEKKIIYYLMKFLGANVTPTCLLYVPQLVHTISFIRGKRVFQKQTRLAADECYNYCHAMFPIPFGCNFETVYTSEMQKFLPDYFDKMEGHPLDYGGIEDILESADDDHVEDNNYSSENYSLL